jgi:hypothetical protein
MLYRCKTFSLKIKKIVINLKNRKKEAQIDVAKRKNFVALVFYWIAGFVSLQLFL